MRREIMLGNGWAYLILEYPEESVDQYTGEEKTHRLGEVWLRLGLKNSEIVVGVNSYIDLDRPGPDASGWEDPLVGYRFQLLQGGKAGGRPEVVALTGTTLPAGSGEFSQGGVQPFFRIAFGWSLDERTSLGANLNTAYVKSAGDRFAEYSGGLSASRTLGRRNSIVGEYFAFVRPEQADSNLHYLTGAWLYLLGNNLQLDARGGVEIGADREPSYLAGIGVTWRTGF